MLKIIQLLLYIQVLCQSKYSKLNYKLLLLSIPAFFLLDNLTAYCDADDDDLPEEKDLNDDKKSDEKPTWWDQNWRYVLVAGVVVTVSVCWYMGYLDAPIEAISKFFSSSGPEVADTTKAIKSVGKAINKVLNNEDHVVHYCAEDQAVVIQKIIKLFNKMTSHLEKTPVDSTAYQYGVKQLNKCLHYVADLVGSGRIFEENVIIFQEPLMVIMKSAPKWGWGVKANSVFELITYEYLLLPSIIVTVVLGIAVLYLLLKRKKIPLKIKFMS
jgi:hypothetical protein